MRQFSQSIPFQSYINSLLCLLSFLTISSARFLFQTNQLLKILALMPLFAHLFILTHQEVYRNWSTGYWIQLTIILTIRSLSFFAKANHLSALGQCLFKPKKPCICKALYKYVAATAAYSMVQFYFDSVMPLRTH